MMRTAIVIQNGERLKLKVLRNTQPVQESDLKRLIAALQEALTIQHWTIKYQIVSKDDPKMGRSLMRVVPTREKCAAKIFIRSNLIGLPTNEFAPLLLHELLHLVVDPIIEEYSYQLEYDISDGRMSEYNQRFLRCFEKTVEHLTNNLSRLITLPSISRDEKASLKEFKDTLETAGEEIKSAPTG